MNQDTFKFITMQQLEALVCLVEERSFSRAAGKMLLTQPSLSKHIRNLESFTNCRLINRTSSGISLTTEGSILYGYARRILRMREEARDKILTAQDTASGQIFTGASTIPATYLLPRVLTALRKNYPDIRVHISSGDSDSIIHMVLSGQTEMGFIGRNVHDRRIVSEPMWDDEIILVGTRAYASHQPVVDIDGLSRMPFVLREKGSGTRTVFEEYLDEHFMVSMDRFQVVSEMGSTEAVKEAVIAGLGVSALSVHAVRRELDSGLLARIPWSGPAITRSFLMIRKRQFTLLPHHLLFLDTARSLRQDLP